MTRGGAPERRLMPVPRQINASAGLRAGGWLALVHAAPMLLTSQLRVRVNASALTPPELS